MENRNTVEQLIFTLGIDNREFARLTKINILTVQDVVKGKKKISLNVLNRILREFPYVNENYLMKGEGEMFINKVVPGDENFNREMLDSMKTLSIAVLNNSEANKERAKAELEFAQGFNRLTIQLEKVTDIITEIVKVNKGQQS